MFILMQNQVYSRYVYQMLMQYGRVAIPTLGTFTLHPVTATFNRERTKLSPPATQLSFDLQVIDEVLLVRQLTDAGMKVDDAALLQTIVVSDYKTSLSQNKNFELDGLGTFYSDGFVEKTYGLFNRYQGLESLSVTTLPTSLKRNIDLVKIPDAPIILTSSRPKSSQNYLWPILICILTLLVILGWFFSGDGIIDESDIVKEGTKTEISHDSVLNDDSLLAEIDSILEKSEFPQNVNDTTLSTIEKPETHLLKKSEEKGIEPNTPLKSCIVIVGAFKNVNNADKLIKRINAKGYDTYTQMHNGLKRVGITYDCVAKDPDMFKSNVQKQFNKDAWHLHDTI